MMHKKIVIPAFILMVIVQWYVPAGMIFSREKILAEGKEFKFRTAPVDPYDPFRGKYITLTFDEISFKVSDQNDWTQGDAVFVSLTTDESGFAKIRSLSKEKPDHEDYVKANIGYIIHDTLSHVTVYYPFDRFYMEESKAEDAQTMYNESALDTTQVTYALVAVKNGEGLVKDVIINGLPVTEAVKRHQEEAE